MAEPYQLRQARPLTELSVQMVNPPHCFHITYFAQIPLGGGQIRMAQQHF
jgi:hypothetical protein